MTIMTSSPGDAEADALALVRAVMTDDREAAHAILSHCDLRAVAADLAFRTALLTVADFRSRERALASITAIQRDRAANEAAE